MTIDKLTPELREKLSKFCEIERWFRAFLTASGTSPDSVSRLCRDAAFREIPLTPEETLIYQEIALDRSH